MTPTDPIPLARIPLARIHWTSPPPTSADEVLVVHDDGTAQLVVRTARDGGPRLGTWHTTADAATLQLLRGQDLELDVLHPVTDDAVLAADRLADQAREHPLAAALFYAAPLPDGGLALQAVGAGEAAASFELDPDGVIVHWEDADGTAVGWHPADQILAGFVSPTPEGLGGISRPAEIAPGDWGAISLGFPPPPDRATAVAIELTGWLRDAVTGEPGYATFRVRTASVPLDT